MWSQISASHQISQFQRGPQMAKHRNHFHTPASVIRGGRKLRFSLLFFLWGSACVLKQTVRVCKIKPEAPQGWLHVSLIKFTPRWVIQLGLLKSNFVLILFKIIKCKFLNLRHRTLFFNHQHEEWRRMLCYFFHVQVKRLRATAPPLLIRRHGGTSIFFFSSLPCTCIRMTHTQLTGNQANCRVEWLVCCDFWWPRLPGRAGPEAEL